MHLSLSRPSLRSHARAVWAIAAKDWRTFWRYPLNAVSQMFQPLIFLMPAYFLGQVFSVNGQAQGFAGYSGTSDYVSFLLLGTALSNFVNAVFWGMGYSLKEDMDSGVIESNWLMPVPRLLLLIGKTLTSLATTAVTSGVMLAIGALLFGFRPTGNVLAAVLTVLPLLVGLYGFGFAFAALVLIMREANTMVDVSSFLVTIFAGTNFPVQALPRWLLPVALVLPLTYGFDAVRGWLLHTRTLLPLALEIILLLVFMVVMLIFGGMAFAALERRVRQLGTLGQH
ncbi:MAG: ABC transporter permease [Anaerolineales bacterium]